MPPNPICHNLQQEYEAIKTLKQEFVREFEKAKATGDFRKTRSLKEELEQKRNSLQEKLFPKEIKGVWENQKTLERKEIKFDVIEKINYFKDFYKTYLSLELTSEQIREVKAIFSKHKEEMKEEIEKYGYDAILIIPENLPDLDTLDAKLIKTMEEPVGGVLKQVEDTLKISQIGGSFPEIKTIGNKKLRVILTKNNQNIAESNDPILEAIENKKLWTLCGLANEEELEKKRENYEELKMNFTEEITDIKGNKKLIYIKAESQSLEENIIHQRMYFDENLKKGVYKHLDEISWTWVLKTFSGLQFVISGWSSEVRMFDIDVDSLKRSFLNISYRTSVRPSHSFSR